VEVTGEIVQPHVRPWSTVLRVPTPDGPVWFKAAREAFAFEPAVLDVLRPLAPDVLPVVLAARPEAGWLLLADAGVRAREHPIDWPRLLARYARLQQDAAPVAERLLEAGALDLNPSVLPGRIEGLARLLAPETAAALQRRLPEVFERLDRLAETALPLTLDHGDLHDANVFSRDGNARILDWGDTAVAHPFFTLNLGTEPGELDAYLECWTSFAPRNELVEEAAAVDELRLLLRALNWERVLAYDPAYASAIEARVGSYLAGAD
jgi:Phosphotransferase enzyme family